MAEIWVEGNNTTVDGTGADDLIEEKGTSYKYVTIHAGAGNDTVWGGYDYYIDGQGGDDYLYAGSDSTLIGGTGDDSLNLFYSGNSYAFGGDGNDLLETGGNQYVHTTLDGGAGDDTISNVNSYTSISGGAGNDYIKNDSETSALTINGGTGDDIITFIIGVNGSGYNLVQYASGDGNDTIEGFHQSWDTLQIAADSYTTTATNIREEENLFDVVIQVGEGSITLKDTWYYGIENFSLNIDGGAQLVGDSESVSSSGSSSTSTVSSSTETVDSGTYTYSGGNQIITSYAGEKINYNTDFTGLGFNDTDFMLNSSSGSLTIKNARNKVIDVAVGGNTVAYAYLASSGGAINGSSLSQLEVILGGNNASNVITAGSGGSSLWGGAGGDDILTGGAGQDNFFFGKGDGADIINNASSSDIVNLYDVSLADIISADISGNKISLTFNTGSSLQVNSAENLSSTFQLADGNWKFNHSSNTWQNA